MSYVKDPSKTQWTNTTLCGVDGYPTYNGRTPILSTCSLSTFSNFMNTISSSLPFSFDYAIAIMSPR